MQQQLLNRLLLYLVCNMSFFIEDLYLRILIGSFFSEYRSLFRLLGIISVAVLSELGYEV